MMLLLLGSSAGIGLYRPLAPFALRPAVSGRFALFKGRN